MTVDQHGRDTGLGKPIPPTADPIDRVVRLAPKWTIFVLAACGLLVAGLATWSVVGTVTSTVATAGLFSQAGIVNVEAEQNETVDHVLVDVNDQVKKGQPVVSLVGGKQLTAPIDGWVTSILVSDGTSVIPGKIVVRVTDLAAIDSVVVLVPASLTGTVVPGQAVRIGVSSAPSSQFGYLLGTVDEISADPYTTSQIASRLDMDEQVVVALLGTEPGLLARIRLYPDDNNATGYKWSVGEGPPFVINQGVPVTANIILSEQHPIQVVFR